MDDKEKILSSESTPVAEGENNKIVETYALDMAKVLGDNQVGLIKKIIHEEEMNEEIKKKLSPQSTQNKIYMTFGSLFLFIALIIWVSVFLKNEPAPVVLEERFTPLITLDHSSFLNIASLSKNQILNRIASEVKNSLAEDGDLEGIYLTSQDKFLGLREFLAIFEGSLVYGDGDTFSDTFLLGFLKKDNNDLFILIKVKSFQDAFSYMKDWEAKMYIDLRELFSLSGDSDLLTKGWTDDFIENKNARILYDKGGNIVLTYVYLDDNSILITPSKEVVNEVISRVFSSKIKQ